MTGAQPQSRTGRLVRRLDGSNRARRNAELGLQAASRQARLGVDVMDAFERRNAGQPLADQSLQATNS